MTTSIEEHQKDYLPNAWEDYTIEELGQWILLLSIRATHRTSRDKALKDLDDAYNYLEMIKRQLDQVKNTI
jgi:hypothetical protein